MTNLSATTQELWKRTVVPQVLLRLVVPAKLAEQRRVTWPGGTTITGPVDMATGEEITQPYAANDPLTAATKTYLAKPSWIYKHLQHPISYNIDEFIQNFGAANDAQMVNLSQFLVNKAHTSLRLRLGKMMYGATAAGAALTTTDADKNFQSINQALIHDGTYGGLARGTTVTNPWWQGASIADTFADGATDYGASVNTFWRALSACQKYATDPAEYLCVVGPTIYLKLKSYVGASVEITNPGPMVKYGFHSFTVDGVEVVEEGLLRNSIITNGHLRMYILHIPDWEFRLHPQRAFEMKDFTWQGSVPNGTDSWLSRILLSGNLICWKPNESIYLSALT